MGKYVALFNSQSAGSDTAASTATAAPSTGTSSPLSSSPVNVSVAATNGTDASSFSSERSSPRSRLVRRRRDGATSGSDGMSTAAASALPNKRDNEHILSNDTEETSQRDLASTSPSSAAAEEVEVAAAPTASPLHTGALRKSSGAGFVEQPTSKDTELATSLLQEAGKGDDGDVRDSFSEKKNRRVSDASDTFDDVTDDDNNEPQPTRSSAAADAVAASSSPSIFTNHSQSLFTCDACMHYTTSSYRDLVRHALGKHGDALVDYTRLRTVAEKLVPVWPQVLERKRGVTQRWGEEVFRVAVQRDAGLAKMEEAHRARAQLELVVQRWHPNARVFIFGSSVAFGVWDGMSDIDFTVVDVEELEAGLWPPSEKNAVRTITELLRRAGFSFINLEPISHARVPIIKHHASLPIRLTDEQRRRLRREAREAAAEIKQHTRAEAESSTLAASTSLSSPSLAEVKDQDDDADTQLEAELVIARSVRYTLNLPSSPLNSAVLEASIRLAVGNAAVQQVWWNRTREMCCVTLDSTCNAMKAATCPLHFISAGMRARVQPLHEECRPELYGMDFDLSFRALGIRNSHLLRCYLLSHPCARPGALVLKDWSKTSGVNNSVNGYLTSYAINIMWIYYLVHHGVIPYVSPTKDIPASLRGNVSGDPEYAAMVDPAWSAEQRATLQAQAGELLLGFFYYYAFDFDWEHHVVSLNRPGVTTKTMLGWDVEDVAGPMNSSVLIDGGALHGGLSQPGPPPLQQHDLNSAGGGAAAARRNRTTTRYSFCIEDPYEENLNLGRHMGVTKTLRVQTELYRGLLSLLKDDVSRCCVFAGASRAEGMAKGSSGGDDGTSLGNGKAGPRELPLRVLYQLMAIATREMAIAKAAHASGRNNTAFPGVPLEQLTAAFGARVPVEWKMACNAWNEQQLLHRLGLKLHGGTHVLQRREVGVRRLASRAPSGVVFAMAPEPTAVSAPPAPPACSSPGPAPEASLQNATAAFPETAAQLANMNNPLLRPLRAHHLSTDLMMAVTRGYECLTPAWVAWSKPWAALSAWWTDQQQTPPASNTTESDHHHDAQSSGVPSSSALPDTAVPGNAATAVLPHQRASALSTQATGAMHATPQQLLHFDSARSVRRYATTGMSALRSSGPKRGISSAVRRAPACTSAAAAPFLAPQSFRRAWRVLLR